MENERERRHREAFGLNTRMYPNPNRDRINRIKNNDPDLSEFVLESESARYFSDLAWELLGEYISGNDYLIKIDLLGCRLTDTKVSLLFREDQSSSLENLNLYANDFGIDGIRSMVPFLKNAQNLTEINISGNRNINTDCFRVLVEALHVRGSIENLYLYSCSIDDIAALEQCALPHLQLLNLNQNNIRSVSTLENYTNLEELYLSYNKIGVEGCRSIAKLLQNDGSRLRELYLSSNDMGDEEAEMLANSLRNNSSIKTLKLEGNKFNQRGFVAFLKLLNDVSSIEGTYNSNHTLKVSLPESTHATIGQLLTHIKSALAINRRQYVTSHAAGRAKVIDTQLNSQKRKELCRLQGISHGSVFADIEPMLLPEVFALVGGEHGQSELYRMLLSTAPGLVSIVNRKDLVKRTLSQNVARLAALEAEAAALTVRNLQLNEDLASMDSEQKDNQPADLCGRKRSRQS